MIDTKELCSRELTDEEMLDISQALSRSTDLKKKRFESLKELRLIERCEVLCELPEDVLPASWDIGGEVRIGTITRELAERLGLLKVTGADSIACGNGQSQVSEETVAVKPLYSDEYAKKHGLPPSHAITRQVPVSPPRSELIAYLKSLCDAVALHRLPGEITEALKFCGIDPKTGEGGWNFLDDFASRLRSVKLSEDEASRLHKAIDGRTRPQPATVTPTIPRLVEHDFCPGDWIVDMRATDRCVGIVVGFDHDSVHYSMPQRQDLYYGAGHAPYAEIRRATMQEIKIAGGRGECAYSEPAPGNCV